MSAAGPQKNKTTASKARGEQNVTFFAVGNSNFFLTYKEGQGML